MLLHEHEQYWDLVNIVATDKGISDAIIEKDYWVTHILHGLQSSELKDHFIFKGGTSLILLLENSNRFSVDIDIITEDSRETIESKLDQVIAASHFNEWKLDEKRSYGKGVPKAHYELEYDSNVNKGSNYI